MIDVVCVYTKPELVQQMKQSALENGGYADVNFILLDNTSGRFSSAAQAYNYALCHECKSEVIIFCHQDIVFYENAVIAVYNLCQKNENVLYGAAGAVSNRCLLLCHVPRLYSHIWQGTGQNTFRYESLSAGEIRDVFTLDECLIAANRKLFDTVRFDEQTCDNWHMYAVELSLQCHVKRIPVCVFDANVLHLSMGVITPSFYATVEKVVAKYKKHFKVIVYPCGGVYTGPVLFFVYKVYRKYYKVLRHFNLYRVIRKAVQKKKEKTVKNR